MDVACPREGIFGDGRPCRPVAMVGQGLILFIRSRQAQGRLISRSADDLYDPGFRGDHQTGADDPGLCWQGTKSGRLAFTGEIAHSGSQRQAYKNKRSTKFLVGRGRSRNGKALPDRRAERIPFVCQFQPNDLACKSGSPRRQQPVRISSPGCLNPSQ